MTTMQGLVLPGDRTVDIVTRDVPVPSHGQVLLAMRASSICGSDIRAIYREHLGTGPEAYRSVIAGHEPCGQVVDVGDGCWRLSVGDRVVVYHVAGCGACPQCRTGYEIGCQDPSRAAYGWQRDGGHAEYLQAEERSCLPLPDDLTYVDGALVSCGFGTAYEALLRTGVSGRDSLLVTGLGPVGLAAGMLARAMGAGPVIGADVSESRLALAREVGAVDHAVLSDDATADAVRDLTGGAGVSTAVDCSGNGEARAVAVRSLEAWGRCAFVGEGGAVSLDVSPDLIHRQISVHGSWVTSIGHMGDLLGHLARWRLHPESVVTDRLPLADGARAYEIADAGHAGKVCLVLE